MSVGLASLDDDFPGSSLVSLVDGAVPVIVVGSTLLSSILWNFQIVFGRTRKDG